MLREQSRGARLQIVAKQWFYQGIKSLVTRLVAFVPGAERSVQRSRNDRLQLSGADQVSAPGQTQGGGLLQKHREGAALRGALTAGKIVVRHLLQLL